MTRTACDSRHVKKRLNRAGVKTKPCITPFVKAKAAAVSLLQRSWLVIPSWRSWISLTNFFGQPCLSSTVHRAKVSKAFARSMKTEYRTLFCSIHFSWTCLTANIMLTVLHPGRNLHCASGRLCSEMGMGQLKGMWAKVLPTTETSEKPL